MQNPNEDTEWNDVLRSKGIIGPKEVEISEDQVVDMIEKTIAEKSSRNLDKMSKDELDEEEDDIDEEEERMFEEYRRKRMQEMREAQQKSKFGSVVEITKQDWVAQVNKAGEDVWVIVHVYSDAIPLCKMINQHLQQLAMKFPQTKFIKSLAQLCIPNYPEKNLPTVFVYRHGDLKTQFIGRAQFGTNAISLSELEWKLSKTGAFTTTLEEAPRPEVRDVMSSSVRDATNTADSDDEDDW